MNSGFLNAGIKVSDALKILHVINNTLHLGIDAFIIIWSNLSYWKIVARVVSIPITRKVANITYRAFTNWLFNGLNPLYFSKK
jgi:hypothetical protein